MTQARSDPAKKDRIVVVGDVMVDHHFIYTMKEENTGESIVSFHHLHDQEIMLEVVRREEEEEGEAELPGGAARVAAVLSNLGCAVRLIGVVGRDSRAESLREKLAEFSDLEFDPIEEPGRPTTLKLRLFPRAPERSGSTTATYRLDRESRSDIAKTTEDSIIAKLTEALEKDNVDAVVVEEYDKGVITERIAQWLRDSPLVNALSVPLIVDPKFQWDKYRGMRISTVLSSFDEFRRSIPDIQAPAGAKQPSDEQLEAAIEKWPDIDAWIITCDDVGEVVCYRKHPMDRFVAERYLIPRTMTARPEQTVGCGAALTAGFAAKYRGASPQEACQYASKVAQHQALLRPGELVSAQDIPIRGMPLVRHRREVSGRWDQEARSVLSGASVSIREMIPDVAAEPGGSTARVVEQIRDFLNAPGQHLLLVHGESGAGKSHIVRKTLDAQKIAPDFKESDEVADLSKEDLLVPFLDGNSKILVLDEYLAQHMKFRSALGTVDRGYLTPWKHRKLGDKKIIAIGSGEIPPDELSRFRCLPVPSIRNPGDIIAVFGLSLLRSCECQTLSIEKRFLYGICRAFRAEPKRDRRGLGKVAQITSELWRGGGQGSVTADCWPRAELAATWLDADKKSFPAGATAELNLEPEPTIARSVDARATGAP